MAIAMECDHRLRWMDFDRYGRMQPAAILDIFQDLAIAHAEELGIGRAAMLERNVVWVVVRSKFEILENPKYGSVVTVRTWPHSLSRFSFVRDFSMRDENGTELIVASQEWVLMDFESRRFVSARDAYTGPTDFEERRVFEGKLKKIADFEPVGEPALVVTPAYSDIDVNGHVNNAMYANFIVNALDPGPEGAIRTLQLDYRLEALPDVPLDVHVHADGGKVLVKGVNPEGAISFACAIDLA